MAQNTDPKIPNSEKGKYEGGTKPGENSAPRPTDDDEQSEAGELNEQPRAKVVKGE